MSDNAWKTLLEELKCRETFERNFTACNVSKIAAFLQVFLCHILRTAAKDIRSFSKFVQPISPSHFALFKFMRAFNKYTILKMQILDPIARSNAAGTTSGCNIMSYPHVEKDLNRNENLNLNLE